MYLLTNSQRAKSVNDLMPMIGKEQNMKRSNIDDVNYRREVLHRLGQLHAEVGSDGGRATEGH